MREVISIHIGQAGIQVRVAAFLSRPHLCPCSLPLASAAGRKRLLGAVLVSQLNCHLNCLPACPGPLLTRPHHLACSLEHGIQPDGQMPSDKTIGELRLVNKRTPGVMPCPC